MKCDQDLCLNVWYDFKKILWQDELNPRVRCAFGNDFFKIANGYRRRGCNWKCSKIVPPVISFVKTSAAILLVAMIKLKTLLAMLTAASEQLQTAAWKVKFCLICHNIHRQLDKHCCISYFAWGLPACEDNHDSHAGGLCQSNTTLPEIRSLVTLASLVLRAK